MVPQPDLINEASKVLQQRQRSLPSWLPCAAGVWVATGHICTVGEAGYLGPVFLICHPLRLANGTCSMAPACQLGVREDAPVYATLPSTVPCSARAYISTRKSPLAESKHLHAVCPSSVK
jgi:hypothetical protein